MILSLPLNSVPMPSLSSEREKKERRNGSLIRACHTDSSFMYNFAVQNRMRAAGPGSMCSTEDLGTLVRQTEEKLFHSL